MRNFNRDSRSNNRGSRSNSGRSGGNFSRPEMFKAVCDECGQNCEVPFKPTSGKPILCNDCFKGKDRPNSRGFGNRDRSFNRSNSREKQMHQAVCDECGKTCEVPFKPSNDKPIFCSDCFAKKNEAEGRSSRGNSRSRGNNQSGQYEKQFQVINEKLDKILQSLSSPSKSSAVKKKVVARPKPKKKTIKKLLKRVKKSSTSAKPKKKNKK